MKTNPIETSMEKPHTHHVIILGASNVAMSLSRLVYSLQETVEKESSLNLLFACGHGRSYGKASKVLIRRLPGILDSGLWSAIERTVDSLEENKNQSVHVLITDVGNDLIYGVSVERLTGWIETCFQKLTNTSCEFVLTGLPLESLKRLSALRYAATQRLFFPASSSDHQSMVGKAVELDSRLQVLATQYNATFIPQPGDWFGFDPIHFRSGKRAEIWKGFCSHWSGIDVERSLWKGRLLSPLEPYGWKPAQRWWGKIEQLTDQPCFTNKNLTVQLY